MARVEPEVYLPDIQIYPGLSLQEILEARGLKQVELAQRMGRPVQVISEIINGKKEITAQTAIELEHVLSLPAHFWLQLQKNYSERVARNLEEQRLEKEIRLAKNYPYSEMVKFKWVKETRVPIERVSELLRWLGVSSLKFVKLPSGLSFRKSKKNTLSEEKLAAWLRHGDYSRSKMTLPEFSIDSKENLIREIRPLTILSDINEAKNLLESIAQSFGIALVFTPEFKSFPVSGVTRWAGGNPIIQISLRYKRDDSLWFSIFHELGHIFLHGKRDVFLEFTKNMHEDQKEIEANKFARDYLIPLYLYAEFVNFCRPYFSEKAVVKFSQEIGIAPSIVVGRLQFDGHIPPSNLNKLKRKIDWKL